MQDINVYPVRDLCKADYNQSKPARRNGSGDASATRYFRLKTDENKYRVNFSEVRGQQTAKRALEIAAAGSHNLLMIVS